MRFLCCILFSCAGFTVAGQDVNGIWTGRLTQEPGGCYPEYFIEFHIRQNGSGLTGSSFDYYDSSKFVRLSFMGSMDPVSGNMKITETKVLQYKIPADCVPCLKTYSLKWSLQKDQETLSGDWTGSEMGTVKGCPPGRIVLHKTQTSGIMQPEASPSITLRGKRKIEIVRTLVFDTSSVRIELYDNGQVDGDTISIYLNQKLILHKKGLTGKPVTIDIPILKSIEYEMVMFAENLGTIPPNTALMVVTSGRKKYELHLSSNTQKSAAVRFRYE
jgi:hypothetical protein